MTKYLVISEELKNVNSKNHELNSCDISWVFTGVLLEEVIVLIGRGGELLN